MSASAEPITVSVTLLSQMFRYLEALKVDSDTFLRSLDLDPLAFRSPDARIAVETYLRIQDEAAEYTHDPCFGLHMGQYAEAGSWSILGFVMMNCKTLAEASEKAGRYSRIIGNMIEALTEVVDRDSEFFWQSQFLQTYARCTNALAYEFLRGYKPLDLLRA